MKLLQLSTDDGKGGTSPVFINPDSVVAVLPSASVGRNNATIFLYGMPVSVVVMETPAEIAELTQEQSFT